MADDIAVTPGLGAIIAADDVGGKLHQRVKPTWGADGTANDIDDAVGKQLPVKPRGTFATITTQFTRPADTNVYAAEDAFSDSTTVPTCFTLTGAARISGGSGIITDAVIGMSTIPATALQGELWIFDAAVTSANDNAAFSLSDADRDKLVAIIPFTVGQGAVNNGSAHIQGLNIGFTCVGSANLRYLVKAKNAYTPASAEVFTARLKITQVD